MLHFWLTVIFVFIICLLNENRNWWCWYDRFRHFIELFKLFPTFWLKQKSMTKEMWKISPLKRIIVRRNHGKIEENTWKFDDLTSKIFTLYFWLKETERMLRRCRKFGFCWIFFVSQIQGKPWLSNEPSQGIHFTGFLSTTTKRFV